MYEEGWLFLQSSSSMNAHAYAFLHFDVYIGRFHNGKTTNSTKIKYKLNKYIFFFYK